MGIIKVNISTSMNKIKLCFLFSQLALILIKFRNNFMRSALQISLCNIQQREELTKHKEKVIRKRDRLLREGAESEKAMLPLSEEVDALAANIDYINDSIADCQANIMQMEETKV